VQSSLFVHLRTVAQFPRAISSQIMHLSTIAKKLTRQKYITYRCSHNMVNFSPLAAEIRWRVCGPTANFNGFRVLAALQQRHRSPEANQTLHDVWPSPVLLHYIYIFGGSCPLMEFCHVQSSRYVQVLHFPVLAALLHGI